MTENTQTALYFDKELLFSNFQGIEDMIPEIIDCYLVSVPKLTLALETAVLSKDCEAIEISAHSMKGLVSNFYAGPSIKLAMQLEKMGQDKILDNVDEVFFSLCEELSRLTKALQDLNHECLF